jgi:hypothetical protein
MTKSEDSPKAVKSPEMKAPASPAISKIQKASKTSPSKKQSPMSKNILMRMLSPSKKEHSSPRKHIPRLLRFGKGKTAKDIESNPNKENGEEGAKQEEESEDYYTRTDWTDTATESTYFGYDEDEDQEDDYEVDPSVIDTFGFDVPHRRHLTPRKVNVQAKQRSLIKDGIQLIKTSSARHLKRTPQKVVTPRKEEPTPDDLCTMSVADKILEEWASQGGVSLDDLASTTTAV